MRGTRTLVGLLLASIYLAACGDAGLSPGQDPPAKAAASAPAGKTARDVARQATGAMPQIVNPAEELNEFAPTGLLRWSAVPGADAYEVWAYRDAGLTQAAEFSGALSSRQYQFTQLAGGQTYYVRLYFRANGVWQEAPTFQLRTTTNVVKARLSNSQEELEAFGPSGTLRWTAVAGADVYELWIYRDAARVAFAETSGPVRITQYQITSLTPGVTYYVQVYARVNGQFTNGGALQLTVTSQLDKARIVNPQEELDAFATNGILRWSPVTGATAYELWIFTNPNVSVIHESSGSLNQRSYQTRTLQPGRVYYAQAYALVNGQWQVGAPVKVTTTATPTVARLTTPQEQLEGFATTGTLRWTEVPGATAYELWIYSNAGLGKIVESGANADRSYTTRRLCSGATYYVQVYAQVNGQWTTGWATRLDVAQGTSAGDCIPPAPSVTLTSSAEDIPNGDKVTLSWTTKFASSCTASDAWSGTKAAGGGQETTGSLTKTSLFTLSCTNQSGTTLAQVLIAVRASAADYFAIEDTGLVIANDNADTTRSPTSIAHLDLNSDGYEDEIVVGPEFPNGPPASPLPVSYFKTQKVHVVLGGPTPADGSALFPVGRPSYVVSNHPLVLDFNGDGLLDIVVPEFGPDAAPFPGGQTTIWLSGSGGWWPATVQPVNTNFHGGAVGTVAGKPVFYGNSLGCIACTDQTPFTYEYDGTGFKVNRGTLPTLVTETKSGPGSPPAHRWTGSAIADVDGDGVSELVLGDFGAGEPNDSAPGNYIVFGNASGWADGTPLRLPDPQGVTLDKLVVLSVVVADINNDGRKDIVNGYTDSYSTRGIQILLNQGNRSFVDTSSAMLGTSAYVAGNPSGNLTVVDLNGDGCLDMVEPEFSPSTSQLGRWLFSDCAGRFVDATIALAPVLSALPGGQTLLPYRDYTGRTSFYAPKPLAPSAGSNIGSTRYMKVKNLKNLPTPVNGAIVF